MNFLDKALYEFAPRLALQREKARAMIDHGRKVGFWRQGAKSSDNRAMSGQVLDHPDSSRNTTDRITCMREMRWIAENNSIVQSILRKYQEFVIGRLSYMPRTDNETANREIKAYVELWMEHADFTGRHHFRALGGMGVGSMTRDGDCGFITSEDDDILKLINGISPIRLQAIEGDRIGLNYGMDWRYGRNKPANLQPWKLRDGERDFGGVVVNSRGQPIRYRIFARREDQQGFRYDPDIEVPAENFIHLFCPNRLDSYRGFTPFAPSINDIKDAMEILGCEKISVKRLSSQSGIMYNESGTVESDVTLDQEHDSWNANADKIETIKPGSVHYAKTGHKFEPLDFNRPSPTFSGFLDTLVRAISLSVNLPFGFVYSWAGQGTAVRMEAAQADREFQQVQLTLEERLLNPIVKRVIARGIQLGHIPDVKGWERGEWRFPAKVTADVGRESAALIDEKMAGLTSVTQIAQDRGEDPEIIRSHNKSEALQLIKDARELVTASGGEIDLPMAIYMLERRGPNAPQAEGDEAAAKPPAMKPAAKD